MKRETVFSPCRLYRYTLWREWDRTALFSDDEKLDARASGSFVQFIGLNPSTADENTNDPTVRRCIDYAKRWGYGAMCMTNIFGFRATDPKVMMEATEFLEFRQENAQWLARIAEGAALIICAWGVNGKFKDRGEKVMEHFRVHFGDKIRHLGLNSDGTPKHPLYLSKTLKPIPFASGQPVHQAVV